MPAFTAIPTADGYLVCWAGVRMGAVYPAGNGWVTRSFVSRARDRSQPAPTASEAAAARWGVRGKAAIAAVQCETSIHATA